MPAICVGLAAGSKYPHGLLLISVMLAIHLFMERGRRLQATGVAITTAGLSFLAVVPYSVLALPDFVNGLARQARHYATGHPGHEADPGLDQLAYYASSLISDFGVAGLVLCLVGLVSAALRDWRRTLVLISFPVALFALFSAQRVHFLRSILPVFPWVAVFITCGIFFLHGRLMRVAWIRRMEIRALRSAIGVVGFLGLFALGLNAPLGKFAAQMEVAGESRVRAVAWIKKHVATDATVIVPEELYLDTRPLASSGYPIRVVEFKALDTAQSIDSLMAEIPGPVVVLVPRWVADLRFPDADGAKDKAAALNEASMRAQLVPLADFSLQHGVLLHSPMSRRYSGGGGGQWHSLKADRRAKARFSQIPSNTTPFKINMLREPFRTAMAKLNGNIPLSECHWGGGGGGGGGGGEAESRIQHRQRAVPEIRTAMRAALSMSGRVVATHTNGVTEAL